MNTSFSIIRPHTGRSSSNICDPVAKLVKRHDIYIYIYIYIYIFNVNSVNLKILYQSVPDIKDDKNISTKSLDKSAELHAVTSI